MGWILDSGIFAIEKSPSLRQIVRGFHDSRPLAAGHAVADFPDDDECLEIAKLGICQEIISALAQKGIIKLFPIQNRKDREVEKRLGRTISELAAVIQRMKDEGEGIGSRDTVVIQRMKENNVGLVCEMRSS